MSNYTLELRYIYKDDYYDLFDFPYNLYDNDLKTFFEEKFYQHFMFNEIGFDTIGQFKQRLAAKLNDIFPYYRDLYETMVRSKGIDFMLNKDLKETYTRELTSNSNSTQSSNSESSGVTTSHDTSDTIIENLDKYMTGAQKDNASGNSTSNGSSAGNSKEEYSLLSQGNIGITSSAELLDKWRQTIINIDMMIFNECEELFMGIY